MHPEGDTVRRALYWVACGLIVLNLPLSAGRVPLTPGAYRQGFAPTVLLLIVGLLGWALWRCGRGVDAALPLQGLVFVCYATLTLHFWMLGPSTNSYPPLLHVLGAGMCISCVLGVRAGFALIPLFAIQVALIRSQFMDTEAAFGEATLLALSGWIATACVQVLQRAGRTVEDAVAVTFRLEEDAVRARQRTHERKRWDALVHDKVLVALQLATRHPDAGVPAPARDLAEQALDAFRGDPAALPLTALETWREHAAVLGLQVEFLITGTASNPDVHEALTQAANEALTNIARHSGQSRATVSGSISGGHATVVITDHGRGFDPDPHRYRTGIMTSIQGRMRGVGGSATLTSSPGRGTRVTLEWDAHRSAPGPTPSDWQLHSFAPIMALGAGTVALNVFIGNSQWEASRHPTLSLLGIAAVVVITSVAAFLDPTRRQGIGLVAATVLTAAVLAADTATSAPFAWRYWYLGALTPAVGALAFRYPRGIGLTASLLTPSAVVFVDVVAGRAFLASLTGPVPVMIGTAVTGHLLRAAMDNTWRKVAEAAAQDADLRLAITIEEVRSQEAAARVAVLKETVGPALQLLATVDRLPPGRDRDLILLEAATRDQLTAPELLDSELNAALRDARARGIRVELLSLPPDDTEVEKVPQAMPLALRSTLVVALRHAAPPLTIRAVLRPVADERGSSSTLTAVGPTAGALYEHLRQEDDLTYEAGYLLVDSEPDCLLLDFAHPHTQPAA